MGSSERRPKPPLNILRLRTHIIVLLALAKLLEMLPLLLEVLLEASLVLLLELTRDYEIEYVTE